MLFTASLHHLGTFNFFLCFHNFLSKAVLSEKPSLRTLTQGQSSLSPAVYQSFHTGNGASANQLLKNYLMKASKKELSSMLCTVEFQ